MFAGLGEDDQSSMVAFNYYDDFWVAYCEKDLIILAPCQWGSHPDSDVYKLTVIS